MNLAGVVIGHFMFVRLLLLVLITRLRIADIIIFFAPFGVEIVIIERAVGHVSTGCIIIACTTHYCESSCRVEKRFRHNKTPLPLAILLLHHFDEF